MKLTQIRNLTIAAVLLLGLFGCDAASPPPDTGPSVMEAVAYTESTAPPETTEPLTEATVPPTTAPTVPAETTEATEPTEAANSTEPTQGKPKAQESKPPTQTPATEPTQPTATQPSKPTEPAQTEPPETQPPETEPPATEPPMTEPPVTEPPTEATEPEPYEITADFKRQVAQYARQYINQYRREAGVDVCDDEVCVTVAPDYAVYENNTTYHVLNQEQVDVICALHTLWLHGAGGEQADFSGRLLKGINLSSRNLSRAVFAGAKLVDCMMYDTKLNTANFDGARLQNCQLINAQAERCSFRNAFIALTDMDTVSTRFSNFTGATISKYSVPKDEPFAFADESQDMGFSM